MAKKKAKTPIAKKNPVTITPKIVTEKGFVEITTLERGNCFIHDGELWLLYDNDPEAICLRDGHPDDFSYEQMVRPVDVEIKWTYRK